MRNALKFALLAMMMVFMTFTLPAAGQQDWPTSPKANKGKKWRIGYFEGGVFYAYGPYLARTVEGLMELGWIERAELPAVDPSGDARPLWAWLAREAQSEFLEFVADAYWSCNWDDRLRKETKTKVIERLNSKKDIDLMLALGTWAGKDLANDDHSIPTLVVSSSNPVLSGIITSLEDSGYDHLHASVSPKRYERQIRLFHQATGFKRLGLAYEDTTEGRTYAAVEDVERVAKERNFQIVRCYAPGDIPDREEAYRNLQKCYEGLAPQADAAYLTIHNGNELKNLPSLLAPLTKHHLFTFAQRTSEEVKHGVLMSLTTAATSYMGLFEALTMAKIFNGAKPRSLLQVYDDPTTRVAVNVAVAQQLGYDPPGWLLEMADEIYNEIEPVRLK
jgi:ABC-type uncharacterized transport system substrate-binding protein